MTRSDQLSASLSIPSGTRVAVRPFPGCDRVFYGVCRGREFGDPNAPGKHFVDLTRVVPDEGASFPIGGTGLYWDVRPLAADELAAEAARIERALSVID